MNAQIDVEAVKDAILRYALGIDTGDASMLASSFTQDIYFDVSAFASVGLEFTPLTGRDSVVPLIINLVGTALDTSHSMTNFRVRLDGNEAELECYAEAQHFRKGEGCPPQKQEHFCIKSRYEVHLVKEDMWKMQKLTIKPFWSLGNPDIMREQAGN